MQLDTRAAVVSRDRILVPNKFVVRLSPRDYERMAQLGSALIDEFTQLVQQHATAQHYSFAGGISIRLKEDESLTQGMIEIDSGNVQGTVDWVAVLDIDGKRYPLGIGPDGTRTRERRRHHPRRHRNIPPPRRGAVGRPAGAGQRPRLDQRIEAERPARDKSATRTLTPSSTSAERVSCSACLPSPPTSTSSPIHAVEDRAR